MPYSGIMSSAPMHTQGGGAPFGVVVNPTSARGRGARSARRVLEAFKRAGVPAVEISGRDAAECRERIAAACGAGLRGLVLVGGDGLVGLAIQLPEARALPIGVVPAGSGNDFARQFSLSPRADVAVARILGAEANPLPVDLGVASLPGEVAGAAGTTGAADREHWFACAIGVGFDASVNRRANAIRLPIGPLRYHLALLAELAVMKMRDFSVELGPAADSIHREFSGILTTVMNTRAIGGGIPLAPRASVHDGLLDVVEVSHGTKLRILSVLGLLARGRHEALPEVTITRADRVRIDAGDEVAYSDGERVGTGPFEIRVAPGALALLA